MGSRSRLLRCEAHRFARRARIAEGRSSVRRCGSRFLRYAACREAEEQGVSVREGSQRAGMLALKVFSSAVHGFFHPAKASLPPFYRITRQLMTRALTFCAAAVGFVLTKFTFPAVT